MRKTSLALKKTAFVPRLAYGCVGAGMSVIPLCVSCGALDGGSQSVGILAFIPDSSTDAPTVGIIPDANVDSGPPTIGIRPYVPEAGVDTDAPDPGGDAASSTTTDASGD
jgi:hypothetical protein